MHISSLRPAREGLHAADVARGEAHDRLVVNVQHPPHVRGVDEIEPGGRRLVALRLRTTEDRVPPGREVHRVGGEVPIPDAVVGGADGEGIALLAARQPGDGARVGERLA